MNRPAPAGLAVWRFTIPGALPQATYDGRAFGAKQIPAERAVPTMKTFGVYSRTLPELNVHRARESNISSWRIKLSAICAWRIGPHSLNYVIR